MSKRKNKLQRERYFLKKAKVYIEGLDPKELEALKKALEARLNPPGLPKMPSTLWQRFAGNAEGLLKALKEGK